MSNVLEDIVDFLSEADDIDDQTFNACNCLVPFTDWNSKFKRSTVLQMCAPLLTAF